MMMMLMVMVMVVMMVMVMVMGFPFSTTTNYDPMMILPNLMQTVSFLQKNIYFKINN